MLPLTVTTEAVTDSYSVLSAFASYDLNIGDNVYNFSFAATTLRTSLLTTMHRS